MKDRSKILFSIVLLFVFFSCSHSDKMNYTEDECLGISQEDLGYESKESKPIDPSKEVSEQQISNKKIERKANYFILSSDVKATKSTIVNSINLFDGYIGEETDDNRNANHFLDICIPSEKLDSFLVLLEGIGDSIVYKNIERIDHTMLYYDHKSRKETKEAMINRYRELLKKANNISDIATIQSKIDEIQEDEDALVATLKEIDNKVAYSSVHITIDQKNNFINYTQKESFFKKIGKGIENGWNGLVEFIVILFNIWPLVITVVVAIYFIIKRKKGKKMGKESKEVEIKQE